MPDDAPYVFLSYASAERERALQIADVLERAGVAVWIDRQAIAGGTSWGSEIVEGIKGCAALVILCSAAALQSRNVRQEIQLAWRYERAYLPLLLEPVEFPEQVQYFLEGWQWVELLDRPRTDWLPAVLKALGRLGIEAHGRAQAVAPTDGQAGVAGAAPALTEADRPEAIAEGTATAAAAPAALPAGGTFVGRTAELGTLTVALEEALAGRGRLLLIAGEPGIGKTTLCEALAAEAARRGARTLWGRCWEGEGAPAFWPWLQLLGSYARTREPELLRVELGTGAVELAQLVPEVRAVLPDLPAPPAADPEAARFRLFGAVAGLLAAATAAQPLVLVLEDLHWADKPSLVLLQFLVQQLGGPRLLVLGTYRDSELNRTHPLGETLAALRREPVHQRLLLQGLSEAETAALVALASGQELGSAGRALAAALYRETEGNPFFLQETLRHLVESGALVQAEGRWRSNAPRIQELGIPEGVREVIGRRLSRLSDECNRVLVVAAVVGREFELRVLAEASDQSEDALAEVLDEAEAARLIGAVRGAGDRYRFSHALIQETLSAELTSLRRGRLHRRVAGAIERHNSMAHAAELAFHYGQAGGDNVAKLVYYSRLAAEQAEGAAAWEEATRHYERVLTLLAEAESPPADEDEAALLLALGRCHSYALEHRAAWRNLMQAIARYRERGDGIGMARATLEALAINAPPERRAALAEAALVLLGDADPYLEAQILLEGTRVEVGRAATQAEARAAHLARVHGFVDVQAQLQARDALQSLQAGDIAAYLAQSRPAAARLEELGLRRDAAWAWQWISQATYELGLDEGDRTATEALTAVRRMHIQYQERDLLGMLAAARLARGDDEGFVRLADQMTGDYFPIEMLRAARAEQAGDLKQALALLPTPDRGGGFPVNVARIHGGRARVRLNAGDQEGARREFAAWAALFATFPHEDLGLFVWTYPLLEADECVPVLADETTAAAMYDVLTSHSAMRYQGLVGRGTDHLRGALALRLDRVDAAEGHYRTGLAWAERERCPIEQGRCLQGLGEVALRRGQPEEALQLLARAAAIFEQQGALLYLHQVQAARENLAPRGGQGG